MDVSTDPIRATESAPAASVERARSEQTREQIELRLHQAFVRVGFRAAIVAHTSFFLIRLASELVTHRRTGWWINALGALATTAAYVWFQRDQARRRVPVIHLGLAISFFSLLAPLAYGMVSSPWWLAILPLAAALTISQRAGAFWGAVAIVGMLSAQALGAALLVRNAAGEGVAEATGARVVLVVLLLILAHGFRQVSDAHAGALEQLSDHLLALNARLEEADRAKTTFLANISHELRTPLHGVIGMATIALDGELPQRERDLVSSAKQAATGLLRIVDDLLDVTKAEAGKIDIEHAPFDLAEVLREALRPLNTSMSDRAVTLLATADPHLEPHRLGDAARVRQIVLNLASNALKFTSRGSVTVRARSDPRDRDLVRVDVVDTGIGIGAEDQHRLFRLFSQVDASPTRRFGGSGLGLAISRRLAQALGGDVTVTSASGVGSTFSFHARLPVDSSVHASRRSSARDLTIRVVSESQPVRGDAVLALDAIGARPDACGDVASAIERLSGAPIDLLVIDATIPIDDAERLVAATQAKFPNARAVHLAAGGLDRRALEPRARGFALALATPLLGDEWALVAATSGSSTRLTNASPASLPHVLPSRSLRVLLAEDNSTNQMLARLALERSGHRVTTAADGAIAWTKLLGDETFDILLTDIQMPELDGAALTERVRSSEKIALRTLPIVALTAHAGRDELAQLRAIGVDDCLTKPFDPRALPDVVMRAVIARDAQKSATSIE
jgi:signal transduction histidine kinase/DNA-binding response OmpR family regulator